MTKTRTASITTGKGAPGVSGPDAAPSAKLKDFQTIRVRLGDLGLAPENLRFDEPVDEDIPQLADTIGAAGVLIAPIVRPGRKNEALFMALDGRRRRMALLLRRDRGEIDDDHLVTCQVVVSKAAEAAALVLPNTERAPIHTAAVILAIGKFRRARMDTAAIAKALGYDVVEIRRLEALAGVHAKVLDAFRQGRLTLKQVKLMARIDDKAQQGQLAQAALDGHLQDYQLRARVEGGRVTVEDPRMALVGMSRYAAAGGGSSSDLFGEMPDAIHDPDLLQRLWQERIDGLGKKLAPLDLAVFTGPDGGVAAPDGFESLPYVYHGDLTDTQKTARATAREVIDAASARLKALALDGDAAIEAMVEVIIARAALATAGLGRGELGAVLLSPGADLGFEARFFRKAIDEEADHDEAEDDDATVGRVVVSASPPDIAVAKVTVELDGAGHSLHETRTDIATRGLIRDLADDPAAALTALLAQLFKCLALRGTSRASESALTVEASAYARSGAPPMPALDGEVFERLAARREAYLASGLRPIGFIDGLPHGEKMALLAELVAVSLDLKEVRNTLIRRSARAEAVEIAALCDADLAAHWCADTAFLALHSKKQLLAMLSAMEVEDDRAASLKKDDLVTLVGDAAAERRWAPGALSWTSAALEVEPDAEPEGEGGTDAAVEDDGVEGVPDNGAEAGEPDAGDGDTVAPAIAA
ncbi:ParB N-terminal domain-containing protein [Caulobacter sp. Root342]|uniref:ParB N-terminal domain-containing protein n=1 Tax=Caulobacter sp. Root342 TaxID=1736519 RepID=UPI0009E95841|nr:ParB N-terminal domain-containing protein [Caulobacter sp. Root342]